MCDPKSEPSIETQRRVRLHDAECHRLAGTSSLIDQVIHHLGADSLPLKSGLHEELAKKERVFSRHRLQPANICTIERDHSDLYRLPALAETGGVHGPVQFQVFNSLLHLGEIESRAVFEILRASWAKDCPHFHLPLAERRDYGFDGKKQGPAVGWIFDELEIQDVPARFLFLPCRNSTQQRLEFRSWRRGIVESVHEGVMVIRIEHEKSLVEQNVDRLPSGASDHEFGARLTEDRCRIIDELAGMRLDPKVDAALRIGHRRALRDRNSRSS